MNLPGTPGISNNDKAQTLNLITTSATDSQVHSETPFLGLAPFLRASIAGTDLRPLGQEMLSRAGQNTADAELWLNLSVIVQCFGQRELGLSIQSWPCSKSASIVWRLPPNPQNCAC